MRYETYAEVIHAYDKGELDADKDIMWMDNDCCGIHVDGEEVFSGDGYQDIVEIARAAGIPCEWV
jgi:hypothetical protein